MTEKNLNTIDERFAESRAFAKKLGYPSGDRWSLPTSTSKFPDGAHFRVEVPTVNSAAAEEFLPGAFATVMFLFLHASISIFTGPPLETPIYFRLEV